MTPPAIIKSDAVFSPDRVHRYALYRTWEPLSMDACARRDGICDCDGRPCAAPNRLCMFVGLNPSTADETTDDPTIRRCIRFARDWGYDGLVMANLYAFRATQPAELATAVAPIGEWGDDANANDVWLQKLARDAELVVAAWGADAGPQPWRASTVRAILEGTCGPLHVLGLTKDGAPRHPLYMPAATRPMVWSSS
jgi:hypothetical protein